MTGRSAQELRDEIQRCNEAIRKTESAKLRKDYTNHKARCLKELRRIERRNDHADPIPK